MNEEEQKCITKELLVCLEVIRNSAEIASGLIKGDDPGFALNEIRTIHMTVAKVLVHCTRLFAEKEHAND